MDTALARQKIVEELRRITGYSDRTVPITDDTEIYSDLRISGLDLHHFLAWVEEEFSVRLGIDPAKHAPPERVLPFLFRKRARQSLTGLRVRDILGAIESKRPVDQVGG